MNDPVAMANLNETHGVPIIYGIKPSAEINHSMGYSAKTFTQKHWLHMYSDKTGEKTEDVLTLEEKKLLAETKMCCSEVMSMKTKVNGMFIKFYTNDILKDRWSCLCYGLYGLDLKYKEKIGKQKEEVTKIVIRRRFNGR